MRSTLAPGRDEHVGCKGRSEQIEGRQGQGQGQREGTAQEGPGGDRGEEGKQRGGVWRSRGPPPVTVPLSPPCSSWQRRPQAWGGPEPPSSTRAQLEVGVAGSVQFSPPPGSAPTSTPVLGPQCSFGGRDFGKARGDALQPEAGTPFVGQRANTRVFVQTG